MDRRVPAERPGRGRRPGARGKLTGRPERLAWIRWSIVYGRPVRELQAALTSPEFAELLAYESLYGEVGPKREDWRVAALQATVSNWAQAFAGRRGGGRRWTAADFLPEGWRVGRRAARSAEEIEAKLEAWRRLYEEGLRARGGAR